jgi:hypothetical protein
MCSGDDQTCPQFELHRQKLLEDLDGERRSFLKSAFVAGGGAAAWPVLFLYELGALGLPWEPSLFSDEWFTGHSSRTTSAPRASRGICRRWQFSARRPSRAERH